MIEGMPQLPLISQMIKKFTCWQTFVEVQKGESNKEIFANEEDNSS
jgi:hypothetical protein